MAILFVLSAGFKEKKLNIEGDMNHDNQLTLVDLSILAERIRNQ